MLAVAGFARSLRHRSLLPIAIFVCLGAASYVWWVLPQQFWALKTKYILFLLPPGVLYTMAGLGWLRSRSSTLPVVAASLLMALVVLANVYLYAFAAGRL